MPWRFLVCQALGVNHSLDLHSLICNKNHTLGKKKKFLSTLTVWYTMSSFERKNKNNFSSLNFWGFDAVVRISNTEGYVRCCQKFKKLLHIYINIYIYRKKNHLFTWENGKAYFSLSIRAAFFLLPSPPALFEVLPASLLLSFTQNIKSDIQRKEAAKDKLMKIKPATGKCAFKVSAGL